MAAHGQTSPDPLPEIQKRIGMVTIGIEDLGKAIGPLYADWQSLGKQLRDLREYAAKCGDKPGCFTEAKDPVSGDATPIPPVLGKLN